MAFEPLSDVVRAQDSDLRGARKTFGAEHGDVGPRDEQDRRAAIRCRRHRPNGLAAARLDNRMPRQKRHKLLGGADWPHAWATAAVGYGEGLVQVKMADVRPQIRPDGTGPTCAFMLAPSMYNLPAVLVDHVADVADFFLENAVRRRVGHHQGGEAVAVLLSFCSEVVPGRCCLFRPSLPGRRPCPP